MPKMNVYVGTVHNSCREVLVNDSPLLYYFEQPNWGFCGTGPSKVAEAIIINEFGKGCDRALINLFLEQVVAKWPGRAGWVITSQEIESWQEKAHV